MVKCSLFNTRTTRRLYNSPETEEEEEEEEESNLTVGLLQPKIERWKFFNLEHKYLLNFGERRSKFLVMKRGRDGPRVFDFGKEGFDVEDYVDK